jgi:RNA polymerase sigma factor (sigma-70 family)
MDPRERTFMNLEDDRRALDGFRRGDRRVLEALYRTHAPDIARLLRFGFAFSSGGRDCRFHGVRSEFDLEDRLQEVFARAFSERARLGYDGLTPFGAYVRTIARNLVIDDFRRKEQVLVEYSIDRSEAEPEAPPRGASEPFLGQLATSGRPELDRNQAELLELVAAFKATLSRRERQVYELRFERELEHDQITTESGLSASKVKTSEQRIRTAFFRFMRRHGYFRGYVQERRGWLRPLRSA